MEAFKEQVTTVTLKLNEAEVEWLKSLVKNPDSTVINETKEDRKIRILFWDSLNLDNTSIITATLPRVPPPLATQPIAPAEVLF